MEPAKREELVQKIASALLAPREYGGATKYEEVRDMVISEYGYDAFFGLQNRAFQRILYGTRPEPTQHA